MFQLFLALFSIKRTAFCSLIDKRVSLSSFDYEIQDKKIIIYGNSTLNSTINSIIKNNSIETVEINVGITEIGDSSFDGCSTIHEISFPTTNLTKIGDFAFTACTNIAKLELPSSISSIGAAAFREMSNLVEIILPQSLESINEYLFFECYNLKTVNLNNAKTIGANSFVRCNNLESISLDNVEHIGREAFVFCTSLKNVTLSKALTKIDPFAFYGTKMLNSITIDEANTNFVVIDNVLYTADKTEIVLFPASLNESEFTTLSSVKTLRGGSFAYTEYLHTLTISKEVASIGNNTFAFASSIKTIYYCGSRIFNGNYFFENDNVTVAVPINSLMPKFGDLNTTQVNGICNIEEFAKAMNTVLIITCTLGAAVFVIVVIVIIWLVIKKKKAANLAASTNEKPLI